MNGPLALIVVQILNWYKDFFIHIPDRIMNKPVSWARGVGPWKRRPGTSPPRSCPLPITSSQAWVQTSKWACPIQTRLLRSAQGAGQSFVGSVPATFWICCNIFLASPAQVRFLVAGITGCWHPTPSVQHAPAWHDAVCWGILTWKTKVLML